MAERHLAGLDPVGWYIATSHTLLGHDKTAAMIGADPGDKTACLLCIYDARPTNAARDAVIGALGLYWQAERYLDEHGEAKTRFHYFDSCGCYLRTEAVPPPGWAVGEAESLDAAGYPPGKGEWWPGCTDRP